MGALVARRQSAPSSQALRSSSHVTHNGAVAAARSTGSRRPRQPELIVLGAEPPVQPLGIVVEHRLAERRLVEDPPEDVFVLVHATHDCVEEGPVEDEAEVLEVVVARTGCERLVRRPRLLKLVEEELVGCRCLHGHLVPDAPIRAADEGHRRDSGLPRLVGHLSNARSLVTWQIAISTQNVVAQPR